MSAASDQTRRRVAGDDWVWVWDTDDDTSTWSDPVIQILDSYQPDARLIASNVDTTITVDDEETPFAANISTDGDVGLGIPATDFDAGVFTWFVLGEVTATIERLPYIEVEVKVSGVRTTVYPRRIIPFSTQSAVRP